MASDRRLAFLFGRHIPECTEDFQKRYEDYFTLQFCARGRLALTIDGQEHTVIAGQLWSMRPPQAMRIRPADPCGSWDHRYIAFRGTLAEEWKADDLLPGPPRFVPPSLEVAAVIDSIIRLTNEHDRWSTVRAANELENLLIRIRQGSTGPQRERRTWFSNAVKRLCDFETWPVDYEALARDLGMSVATLRRRFHQQTGMSPHHYALGVRIAEAKRLLVDTRDSICVIGDRLGYHDVQYFSRQFRESVGVPPTVFRSNFAHGPGPGSRRARVTTQGGKDR